MAFFRAAALVCALCAALAEANVRVSVNATGPTTWVIDSSTGGFAPRPPEAGIAGSLFKPAVPTGCSAYPVPAAGGPWVALVQRGECTFVEKVRVVW